MVRRHDAVLAAVPVLAGAGVVGRTTGTAALTVVGLLWAALVVGRELLVAAPE